MTEKCLHQDESDLSFAAGDIIEIVEETNADWWTGKVHGKQGLMPSSYVEKLREPVQQGPTASGASTTAKPVYKPFGAAYHGVTAPPPSGQGVNNVGLQEAPDTEAKKDKFGKYKNTVCSILVLSDSCCPQTLLSWRIPLSAV